MPNFETHIVLTEKVQECSVSLLRLNFTKLPCFRAWSFHYDSIRLVRTSFAAQAVAAQAVAARRSVSSRSSHPGRAFLTLRLLANGTRQLFPVKPASIDLPLSQQ
jgi:hypothetical protein